VQKLPVDNQTQILSPISGLRTLSVVVVPRDKCSKRRIGEFGIITTTTVSPQPELTSTSTGKASMPLTSAVARRALWRDKAADKTRASMKLDVGGRRAQGQWRKLGKMDCAIRKRQRLPRCARQTPESRHRKRIGMFHKGLINGSQVHLSRARSSRTTDDFSALRSPWGDRYQWFRGVLPRWRQLQFEPKSAAFAFLGFDSNLSAHPLNQLAHDG
jgi:hypothetical protein